MPVGFEDSFCRYCGTQGVACGTVVWRLAHVPVGWGPTQLLVRVRRFACTHCRRVWRQDTWALAELRERLTHSAVEWGLRALGLEFHVDLPCRAGPGDLLAHRQQRDPDPCTVRAARRPSPLRRRRGPRRRRARLAPHQAGRPLRYRGHRPDSRTRPEWSSPAAGRGPGQVQEGPQDLARPM